MADPHFTPVLFDFLNDLEANNNREWFQANKDRYKREVQEPVLAFIADFAGPLRQISPRFVADPRPNGGSGRGPIPGNPSTIPTAAPKPEPAMAAAATSAPSATGQCFRLATCASPVAACAGPRSWC